MTNRRPAAGVAGEPGGFVAELWRYPVNSMLGERCEQTWLDGRGVVRVDARRLRPNLLVRTGQPAGPAEDRWVGKTAQVGASAVLEFTHRTERCVMVNNAQDDLPESSRVLRAIGEGNQLLLGIYAKVIRPGPIGLGDELCLLD